MHHKDLNKMLNNLKGSARKRGIPFTISIVDLNNLSFPITCPLLNIKINYHRRDVGDDSPSVDRIDSSRGYEPDNIWIISYKANRMKNDGTLEELRQMAKFYIE